MGYLSDITKPQIDYQTIPLDIREMVTVVPQNRHADAGTIRKAAALPDGKILLVTLASKKDDPADELAPLSYRNLVAKEPPAKETRQIFESAAFFRQYGSLTNLELPEISSAIKAVVNEVSPG